MYIYVCACMYVCICICVGMYECIYNPYCGTCTPFTLNMCLIKKFISIMKMSL